VYNLLKAVNEITLKRMEDKHDILQRDVAWVVQAFDRFKDEVVPRMERAILAIKAKTDRLP
jgi:hypothetical protein